ncbi:MAG: hypothetical protein GC206_05280 [Alphaproteobacteria bacterium]|nr:hypothetical protein [Alphaproteobacteria bacterium]
MRLTASLAALSALSITLFVHPAAAQMQTGPSIQTNRAGALERAPTPRPRFTAEAMIIHAINETGWDRSGSDEVYVVFEDRNNGQRRFTESFGDVDTGETRRIRGANACMGPLDYAGYDNAYMPPAAWRCRSPGEAGGLDFTITLYEQDGWSPFACAVTPNQQAYKKNCDDDLIANFAYRYSAARLVQMMPEIGDMRRITTETRGGYALTFRLRRLPDAFDPPVVLQ